MSTTITEGAENSAKINVILSELKRAKPVGRHIATRQPGQLAPWYIKRIEAARMIASGDAVIVGEEVVIKPILSSVQGGIIRRVAICGAREILGGRCEGGRNG